MTKLQKYSPFLFGGAGVLIGFAAALSLGAAEHPGGKYQLKVWSTPPGGGMTSGDHGAFRIDTETGTVWSIPATSGRNPVD